MKKLFAVLLALAMMLSCCACGKTEAPETETPAAQAPTEAPATEAPETEAPTEAPTEPAVALENEDARIEGIYVDLSYDEGDGSPLKMVYVFLTLSPAAQNTKADAKYSQLTIGANTYESDFYKRACTYMPSYYYSSFIEDVYVGTEFKVALTFKVPEGDLTGGKDVTLTDSTMPLNGLRLTTDAFVLCESAQAIGELVDTEACAQVVYAREPADDATTQKVAAAINGYYFTFYVSAGTSIMTYELEFWAPNNFELRTPILDNSGTYEVRNGYIFLTYPTGGDVVEIAYEFGDDIILYCSEAFSIYE